MSCGSFSRSGSAESKKRSRAVSEEGIADLEETVVFSSTGRSKRSRAVSEEGITDLEETTADNFDIFEAIILKIDSSFLENGDWSVAEDNIVFGVILEYRQQQNSLYVNYQWTDLKLWQEFAYSVNNKIHMHDEVFHRRSTPGSHKKFDAEDIINRVREYSNLFGKNPALIDSNRIPNFDLRMKVELVFAAPKRDVGPPKFPNIAKRARTSKRSGRASLDTHVIESGGGHDTEVVESGGDRATTPLVTFSHGAANPYGWCQLHRTQMEAMSSMKANFDAYLEESINRATEAKKRAAELMRAHNAYMDLLTRMKDRLTRAAAVSEQQQ